MGARRSARRDERELVAVFSPLARGPVRARDRDDLRGLPGPLRAAAAVRAGRPDAALLLGDYLYAHGLVRIAGAGDVAAVADLAELISLCAQLRADGGDGDGAAWAATAALLGTSELCDERAARCASAGTRSRSRRSPARRSADVAVERALGAHEARVR